MNTPATAEAELRRSLDNYLEGGRTDGVLGDLIALEWPDLQLDLLPDPPTPPQLGALEHLGYRPTPDAQQWIHPGGWCLRLTDVGQLDSLNLQALTTYLSDDPVALERYLGVYRALGRAEADAQLWPEALAATLQRQGFGEVRALVDLFSALPFSWMVASGWALELHLGQRTRLHHDLDVVVPPAAQPYLHALLSPEWRLDACVNGTYRAWDGQAFDGVQVHARRQGWPMLDLMFGGVEDRARRVSPLGWPFLTPEAVLLFKAGRPGSVPRGKDLKDFQCVLPGLDHEARTWLTDSLRQIHGAHPWLGPLG
ncbi:nucleotidyltransferase domain-containing protein [Deinococcus rubellus]|uniref:Uncharacterized protein n=1 Tax=Deinococcus rubellus TaxID=1889240 RepID=A0ABY5YGY5_9DEIO|nr:hypothetical protein [Deinococcus rubellus]UWX63357.1 hypothetical protein N0D28_11440 [Deinococcus rubellus]